MFTPGCISGLCGGMFRGNKLLLSCRQFWDVNMAHATNRNNDSVRKTLLHQGVLSCFRKQTGVLIQHLNMKVTKFSQGSLTPKIKRVDK